MVVDGTTTRTAADGTETKTVRNKADSGAAKIGSKYSDIDKTLFGGILPGGSKLAGSADPRVTQPAPIPTPTQVPSTAQDIQKPAQTQPEIFTDKQGNQTGISLPDGRTFLGLSPSDIAKVAQGYNEKQVLPNGTVLASQGQASRDQQFAGQQLAAQVGQTQGLAADVTDPTGLNTAEALTVGVRDAIPRALSLAVAGAGVGATGGAFAGGVGAVPGAVIGATAGFVGGITSSIISNFKEQRRDTTNAQKRTLDEGKQDLNDFATLAAADPANKAYYLSQFNLRLAQIEQAYSQMKLDTNSDLAKFETAIPDLAEFENFFSYAGERDTLIIKMQQALAGQDNIDYNMLELTNRRYNK